MKKRLSNLTLSFLLLSGVSCGQKLEEQLADNGLVSYNSAPTGEPGKLAGTAAVGAPVPNGIIKIKCSDKTLPDVATDAFGKWKADVSDCSAPYLIRVKGSVGGEPVDLLSAADAEDVGEIVNVTPITHMVVANVIGSADPAQFDSFTVSSASISKEKIKSQQDKVKKALETVIKHATGSSDVSGYDLMNTPFATDHSGLDALLDVVKMEVSGSSINLSLADGTAIVSDNVTQEDDLPTSPVSVDETKVKNIVSAYTSVDTVLRNLVAYAKENAQAINTAQSLSQLPAGYQDIFHSSFLDRGYDPRLAMYQWFGLNDLNDFNERLGSKQAEFANARIKLSASNSERGILFFDFILDGKLQDKAVSLQVAKENGSWRLYGDQIPYPFHASISAQREIVYDSMGSQEIVTDSIALEVGFEDGAQVGAASQVRISHDSSVIATIDMSFEDWNQDGVQNNGEPNLITNGEMVNGGHNSVILASADQLKLNKGAVGEYKLEFLDSSGVLVGSAATVLLADPALVDFNLSPSVGVSTPSGSITLPSADPNASVMPAFCDTAETSFNVTVNNSPELSPNYLYAYISDDNQGQYEYGLELEDLDSASLSSLTVDGSSVLSPTNITYKSFGVYLRNASELEYSVSVRCN